VTTLVDAPDRVDGIHLIGEMVGSGYRTPPSLVRRPDGQVLQLTPLLYTVLSRVDGARTCAEVAEIVGRDLGRSVTATDIQTLVDGHLRPLGLLKRADGSQPEVVRSNPLLRLRPRIAITRPRTTRRVTDPFRVLFRPLVVAFFLLGFLAVVTWVFFERGLGASAYDAFQRPHLLLLVFVVSILSGGFHEFGHAAAARYSGGQPGAMGAGLYLVWPAFYTDVTDTYRLDRVGRVRTDLGGLYFNAIVVVLTFAWWWATRWEALLLLVAVQVMQMVQQLLPLLKYDGYHVLADLAGVPDLYHRIRPTLVGLLPHRWRSQENRVLKPWARGVITAWVLVTVPMMAFMLFAMIKAVPRLMGSAGAAIGENAAAVGEAYRSGGFVDVAANTVQVLGVALPMLACVLVLGRLALRFLRGLAGWSEGSLVRRGAATALSAALIAGLSLAWWPDSETYRPIERNERGLLTSLIPGVRSAEPAGLVASEPRTPSGTAARTRLASTRPLVAAFQKGRPLPTKEHPTLAMVLVPTDDEAGSATRTRTPTPTPTPSPSASPTATPTPAPSASGGTAGSTDGTWVFPFDKPLPPEKGDNQALAVNTTDGTVTYDLAFALVWAEGDEVLDVNEAHAYASCSNCVAVAVAFQVVLIVDDARVIVPQNLAVAANYDCYECITAAIASQLVLTVDTEPGEEDLRALGEVWNRLIEFGRHITSFTLTQITAQLDAFKAEIVSILAASPAVDSTQATSPVPTPTSSASPSASPSASASPGAEPTTSSSPTTKPSTTSPPPSKSPTPSPTEPEPTPEPTPEPESEPEPTPSPEPTQQEDTEAPSPTEAPTTEEPAATAQSTPATTSSEPEPPSPSSSP
jgi:putative peptide zinc metalloprotease protein